MRDVSFIAANMRELDRKELYCQRAYSDEFTFTMEVVHNWGWCSSVVAIRDRPVACLGLTEFQPGVWSAWAFGTDETWRVVPYMSRLMMRALVPLSILQGARRVEARSLAEHHAAHRWMASLGALGPVVLDEYGKNGEKFVLYWWTLSHVLSGEVPHVLRSAEPDAGSTTPATSSDPLQEHGAGPAHH